MPGAGDRVTSSTGSGTLARVEHLDDGLERVLAKLDIMFERMSDLRVELAGCRGDIANVRALVDGVHDRAEKLENAYGALVMRVNLLEAEARDMSDRQPRRPLAASAGVAAGAGGAVAAIAEIVRAIIGGT